MDKKDIEGIEISDTAKYEKVKAWYESIFAGCGSETLLYADGCGNKDDNGIYILHSRTDVSDIKKLCSDKPYSEEAFLTSAFALALCAYTSAEQAVFTVKGNIPVFLPYEKTLTVEEYIGKCSCYLSSARDNGIAELSENEIRDLNGSYGITGKIMFGIISGTTSDTGVSGRDNGSQICLETAVSADDALDIICRYDPSSYSEYTVKGFAHLIDHIIGEMMIRVNVNDITLVDEKGEETIVSLYDTDHEVKERPAYRLLQDAAKIYPDNLKVIAIDRKLTHKELNEEANALGHCLADIGAGPEVKVAVLADRDSYAYVMREGVLKSGGAFMPIDPEYPEDRISYILEDSHCNILVTSPNVLSRRKGYLDSLRNSGITVVNVAEAVKSGAVDDLNVDVPPTALAYVIYTSGSTGKPKGVMLTNSNLVNYADDNEKNLETLSFVDRADVLAAVAPFTFDVSIAEEFLGYSRGKTTVIATMEQIMDAAQMRDLIINNHVGFMTCTPTYLMTMIETESFRPAVKQLKVADLGAEVFPATLYDKLMAINPGLYVVNSYGPTECTVSCTLKEVVNADDITVGKPLANVKMATVDREGRLQPPGAMGELVIMGAGVGRGYIGRDDLNERSFIKILGLPAYRSGDLVRIREDGDIDFHGRMDNQVKLRGLRVELSEIETVLGSYPGIRSCAVIVAKGNTDYLAAYFTAEHQVEISSLRSHLAAKLTEYMVPQAYMQLDVMPVNANGKIDRKALPEITVSAEDIVAPETPMQEKIIKLAEQALNGNKIGITTDLFAAGLSSVGCMRLCALIYENLGKNIKVAQVYENNTVAAIEKLILDEDSEVDYSVRDEYPLSMTQTGIYIECERYPDSTTYNLPFLYELDSSVDLNKLKKAVEDAVRSHPYLFMTPCRNAKGELFARRRDDEPFEIKIVKCKELPDDKTLVRPFDLESDDVLFRAEIYETDDGRWFFLDTHHIVSDGGSLDILVRDIERAYQGEHPEKESYTGYEYALDEIVSRNSEQYKKAEKWYEGILADCGGETVPVRDGVPENGRIAFERSYGVTDAAVIRKYCEDNSLTLNAFFMSATALALSAYTASEQAVFTTVYNGRNDARLENSVSMLVKTLPVYMPCDEKISVKEYINKCQNYLLTAMANDVYSFAELRQKFDIRAEVIVTYQGEFEHGAMIGGSFAALKTLELSRPVAPLGLDILLDGDRIVFEKEYDPSSFSGYTVNGFTDLIDHIAGEMISKDNIQNITLISEQDKKAISELYDSAYPVVMRPAYRLLQDQTEKTPDRKAVVADDRTLTFRQLNEEANALGHCLKKAGAGPDTIVATLGERNSYAYVMRQGILKSGGAFLPIDPEYPEDRIRFIVEDAGVKLIVTTGSVIEKRRAFLDELALTGIRIIDVCEAVKEESRNDLNVDVSENALAYVIYTSGSTGRPKGVMLTNKNLVNFVDPNEKNNEILGYTGRGTAALAIAALTFDFSIMEEFVPIANGMTVVLATHEQIMDPIALAELMSENRVDVMSCTPSYIMNLLDMGEYTDVFTKAVKRLRSIDFGAEAFPSSLLDKLKAVNPDIYIMNGYGPTEATISCTMQVIENADNITIGIPNANVSVCTVDRDGRLQPLGALGEMIIMGDGVGRGYVGRDDLTQRSFITMLGKPAYRSGDLVRICEDGNIEFHGRIDNQVKLRGLRVELGEIENVINTYPSVNSCIVIVVRKETEYLAAYFTANEQVDTDDLRVHIASKLTEYMVPQVFMQLEKMPLTANGKINKKALPEPNVAKEQIVPPESEMQQEIMSVVRSVIGDAPVGITTDLFAAGLSSLSCIRLGTLLSGKFEKNIGITEIFEGKTIRALEKVILQKDSENAAIFELREKYPLTMTQMGIFAESIKFAGTTVYNIPCLYKLPEDTDIKRYKEAVQTAFMAHPYIYMTLEMGEDEEVYAVRHKVTAPDIATAEVLPSKEELVRPFDLTAEEPLYRVAVYDTKEGKYLFIDLHHIIADGESYDILFRDIHKAYRGEPVKSEEYTGYEAALHEKNLRMSSKLQEAFDFYDRTLSGCTGTTLPQSLDEKDSLSSVCGIGTVQIVGNIQNGKVKAFCEECGLSLNAFFTTAFALTLKTFTGSRDVVFTTIYHGRNDPRTADSVAMFVKTFPVRPDLSRSLSVTDAVRACSQLLISLMANDIVSFAEVRNKYGIESDIIFAYQGGHSSMDETEETDLALSQAKSLFGLDVSLDGEKIIYDFEYDPSVYAEKTINAFYELMEAIIAGMLEKKDLSAVCSADYVKALVPEHPSVISATGKESDDNKTGRQEARDNSPEVENAGSQESISIFIDIFRKVLSVSEVNENSNFFELGGTSLSAAKVMMAAMSKQLRIVYQDVFDNPTPAGLAAVIARKHIEEFGEGNTIQSDHAVTSVELGAKKVENALAFNSDEFLDEIPLCKERLHLQGNVMLAGATGYLGIHILNELLKTGTGKIYCLIGGHGKDVKTRLESYYTYYFNDPDQDAFKSRVIAVEADITDAATLKAFDEYDYSVVINCAACVKHFAKEDMMMQVNVYGVQNLVKLCLEKKARFIHISSVSVAGDSVEAGATAKVLSENNLELGQEVESNVYVHTKYLAEKYILHTIENEGLDAKIMRVGNLMGRNEDGEFQINFNSNNFMNTLKAYAILGCFPVNKAHDNDELSPVDEVAKAVVLLSQTPDKFTVFHPYNSHSVEMGDIIYAINESGIKIDLVEDAEFEERLSKALSDEGKNQYMLPLVGYDLEDKRVENISDNAFTVKALYRLGFKWSLTDVEYIRMLFESVKTLGFFDV